MDLNDLNREIKEINRDNEKTGIFRNRKPAVDYSEFRLNRINEPQFAHIKLLAGWLVYFRCTFLLKT